jgi:hypothetical protein
MCSPSSSSDRKRENSVVCASFDDGDGDGDNSHGGLRDLEITSGRTRSPDEKRKANDHDEFGNNSDGEPETALRMV